MVKSAMTKEEWGAASPVWFQENEYSGDRYLTPEARHGLAARCLHGQSFGFRKEDVALERSQVHETPVVLEGGHQTTLVHIPVEVYPDCLYEIVVPRRVWDAWCDRADRIAALLPEEG